MESKVAAQLDTQLGWLLMFSFAAEALTGVALFVVPSVTARLLLGGDLGPEPAAVARVLGVALLSLATACWPGLTREPATPAAALRGMLAYNGMAGAFLLYVWARGETVGALLLPAWAFHLAMALALGTIGTLARRGGPRRPAAASMLKQGVGAFASRALSEQPPGPRTEPAGRR
jgi:hypothetical protein